MFNKNLKLVIAGLIIAYAIYQFIEGNIGNGISLILLSTIFIFLYFRNEIILLSFLRMRKQDLAGTKKWLDKIKNPEAALTVKQQGYYNYLHGIIFSQTTWSYHGLRCCHGKIKFSRYLYAKTSKKRSHHAFERS